MRLFLAIAIALLPAVAAADYTEIDVHRKWQVTVGAYINNSSLAHDGRNSLRLSARGVAGVRLLGERLDVRNKDALVFWTFGLTNSPGGFPPPQPIIVLRSPGGYSRYDATADGVDVTSWQPHRVPLAGDAKWTRRVFGAFDPADVRYLEIYFRGAAGGWPYRVYLDGVDLTAATQEPPPPEPDPDAPLVLKIFGIVYNPVFEAQGGRRLHEIYGGFDPVQTLRTAARKMGENSQGTVEFRLVDIRVRDDWPLLLDGFRYTDETFDRAFRSRTPASRAQFDYRAFIAENGIAERVNRGEVDEVWLATGNTDFFRTWESNMVGPGAYYLNSQPTTGVPVNKVFVVQGFNYQHSDSEDVGHAFGHRIEDVMSRIYGLWSRSDPSANTWSAFAAIDRDAPGRGGVGNIHYPVNGERDYDYDNARQVWSTADDWLNYPRLTGQRKLVSRQAWRRSDDAHVDYLDWFYARLPHGKGRCPDGKLCSWWSYIVQLEKYKNGDTGQ